ncbi:hypothetical protein BJY04DRAFT_217959 [Aspergillus karnatakaensis]|uniref:uncharacterized protein n=1 Tax=Aspergillus karnatakaensis TaxID=1810916 RepID=UPI003CCE3012
MSTSVSTQALHVPGADRLPSGTLHLVGDYGVHVSNSERDRTQQLRAYDPQLPEYDPTLNEHPHGPNAPPRPEGWEYGWREVPPYRPTNRYLDRTTRIQGFPYNVGVLFMGLGCLTQAVGS